MASKKIRIEKPPRDIKWSSFVDPHTGNEFSLGDCVVIEKNYVLSTFDRRNVEVNIGDKCVLLDFLYEPNEKRGCPEVLLQALFVQ